MTYMSGKIEAARAAPRGGAYLLAAAALLAALAGCSSGGGDGNASGAAVPSADIGSDQIATSGAFIAVVKALIATQPDNADAATVPAASPPGDDTGEPVATGA